ncbi:MAG: UDP-N-acetylmuramoyl-L-alanine--D-glutamate ligase [Negativibacillus sp.]
MNQRLEHFYRTLSGKRISLIGLGRTHRPLIPLFLSKGASVLLRDKRTRQQIGEDECKTLEAMGVDLKLGENYLEGLSNDSDIVLRTPGVYYYLPELQAAIKAGVSVTSELELFFQFCPCKTYGITGSDGKTTTTSIIAELLRASGKQVYLGGNIGNPLFQMLDDINEEDVAVIELSNFQLLSMRSSPDVAVVTNVAPNHLDVHKTMEEYIDSKRNIVLHQNGFSRTVLNIDNQITMSFLPQVRGDALFFSRRHPVEHGAFLRDDGMLCMEYNGCVTPIVSKEEIRIPGLHNVENYLAAFAATWGEVSVETMAEVANNFSGVEHRIEFVRELNGVKWYNDSIASSPTRTIAGLDSFQQKIILIAGGYDKQIPYAPLAPKILEKVKILILMGDTAPKIEEAISAAIAPETLNAVTASMGRLGTKRVKTCNCGLQIYRAKTMEEAVTIAHLCAMENDIVSLSPASASFDLYKDFEERGRHFKQLVMNLK